MNVKDFRNLVFAALMLAGAACVTSVVSINPDHVQQAVSFDDETYFHNVGIAWDGAQYFTLNGGNEEYGQVSSYEPDGELDNAASVEIDGRAIFYCPTDRKLYIKNYGLGLYVYDPDDEEARLVKANAFHGEQSSPALSGDGKTIYELADGTLYIMSFPAMKVLRKIKDFSTADMPYNSTIAASRDHLFTWDPEGYVTMYSLKGKFQSSFMFEEGLHPMSLTWTKGMLWGAIDADGKEDGAIGTWHGYNLGRGVR